MLTQAGIADLAANSGAWTGNFVLRLATGGQTVNDQQTMLQNTYELNPGTPYDIPMGAWSVQRNAANVIVGIKAVGVAPSDLAAVTPTRWGLFKGNVLYAIGVAPPQARKFGGTALILDVSVPIAGTTITTFTPTNNITVIAVGSATQTEAGSVQLVPNASSYTQTGAFVLSPAQVQALLTTVRFPFASSVEINTGTDNAKAIPPGQLAASSYRRVHASTSAPQNSQGADGDLWVEYMA